MDEIELAHEPKEATNLRVARQRRNYLWQKRVSRGWLLKNEEALTDFTSSGIAVIERPNQQRLLVESFCSKERDAKQLRDAFGGTSKALPGDWQTIFRSPARQPLKIGSRLLVVDDVAALSTATTRQALVIPAAAAFGTGEHVTTAMCLRMVERLSRNAPENWSFLDLGTGSGILALAAHCFGAATVVGIDNDPVAISTAKQNARLNHIHGVRFEIGDILKLFRMQKFEVVTANLFSELLIAALPQMRRLVRSKGNLVLSGILRAQQEEVQCALDRSGFSAVETRRRGKWVAMLVRSHSE